MLPIELFGWIVSFVLAVCFVSSLVMLAKDPQPNAENENAPEPRFSPEKEKHERPRIRIY